tara:strand:+ start:441 stop:860 length:420 start_codon:yes stop_codon:yes gene_type:complete
MSYNYNKLSPTLPEGAKALDLVLTGQWWDAWQEDKDEDYRELTSFWLNRLIGSKHNFDKSVAYGYIKSKRDYFESYLKSNPKKFTHIRLSKAYEKDRPSGYVEFGGIEIREGKPEWGATAGRLYFCIMRKGYKQGDKAL